MQQHKQMHLESLNLTLICNIKQGDEWERFGLAHMDEMSVKNVQETELEPANIYL